jgi:hypothetical protein
MSDVTRILSAIEQGDPSAAAEQLLPLVYDELRKLAAQKMAQEQPGQTLQATALVHEAYIRLVDVEKAQQWNRMHLFHQGQFLRSPANFCAIQARPIGRRGAKRNGMPGRLMMRRGAAGVRRRRVRRAWLPPYRLSPLRCRPPLHFATPPRSGNRRQRMPCDREYSRDTH